MILVIGSIEIQEAQLEKAITESAAHVRRSRREPGCMAHAVNQDLENRNRLVFVEQWSDRAALDRHFTLAESRNFVKSLSAMAVAPPSLAIYDAELVA